MFWPSGFFRQNRFLRSTCGKLRVRICRGGIFWKVQAQLMPGSHLLCDSAVLWRGSFNDGLSHDWLVVSERVAHHSVRVAETQLAGASTNHTKSKQDACICWHAHASACFICANIHRCVGTHAWVHRFTYLFVYVCMDAYACANMCMYGYVTVRVYMRIRSFTSACMYVFSHVFMHAFCYVMCISSGHEAAAILRYICMLMLHIRMYSWNCWWTFMV